MKRKLGIVAFAALAACGTGAAVTVEGACVAVVDVNEVLYGPSSDDLVDPADVATVPYVEITRYTGCLDQGQPGGELAHGESNFLTEGTTLHAIAGHAPEERLAYFTTSPGEWRALEPWP